MTSILPLILGCHGLPALPTGPALSPLEPASAAPQESTIEIQLHLASPADDRLFYGLRRHAATGISGWRFLPFRRLGNFVEARWCSPSVSLPACDGGAVVNEGLPGTAWRQLATLTYDSTWPECFGVVWNAGDLPETGWGATVFLAATGGQVVGEGFGATFVMSTPEAHTLHVGDWFVKLGSKTLTLESPGPLPEARALVQSPENFTATVKLRYEALIAKVRMAEKTGAISVWEEGPYLGGGIPPERTEVPASKAEAARLAAEAEAQLSADMRLLVTEAGALQPKLAALLPAEVLR